ncbi:MAG TPA: glycosyltransferase family 4 protein [Vicinamibacterales bacterium]|nr:glycosyltransferase family 4 protein [Vicinamibacterales bacterium]
MSTPLRVLIVTDAFPPVCGGSGWSTWELVGGLLGRGHHVDVVKIEAGDPTGVTTEVYEQVRVTVFRQKAPALPVARNLVKNERTWARAARFLDDRLSQSPVDIVHAQHVMSTTPAIRAAARTRTPVVATVRDYWPVCYWADLTHDPTGSSLCPACTTANMRRCVLPRAGRATIAAWSLIPYMRANLRTKRLTLAQASTIIAVSSRIAHDLESRTTAFAHTPIVTIPNAVNLTALDRVDRSAAPIEGPYGLYVGKLAPNKGAQWLPGIWAGAGLGWPLVVAGDGPLRPELEADARRRGLDVRWLGWRDRAEVWAYMRHATLLAFPSYGPESLSRVLLEAAALGVPIAAMNTGGTADIIHDGTTGLLSDSPDALARDLARLGHDEILRGALGHAARNDVRARFSTDSVVDRIEQVYRGLLPPRAA